MATTAKLIDFLEAGLFDSNGDPLSGYQVRTFAADGSTPLVVFEDRAKTLPTGAGKSEFNLSTTGQAEVYGDGVYVIKIWTDTADPDADSPYDTVGPASYDDDLTGALTGDLTGDVKAANGTVILDSGTDGTDATYTGSVDVGSDVNGDVYFRSSGNLTRLPIGTAGQSLKVNTGGTLPEWASTSNTLQVVNLMDGAATTGATALPYDDTIPQNTEGNEFMTLAITPGSATSTLKIEVHVNVSCGANSKTLSAALFQDSTASALAATAQYYDTQTTAVALSFIHYMTSGTTSETTFKVRVGASDASTVTFNGTSTARIFGGVMASSITITEIE